MFDSLIPSEAFLAGLLPGSFRLCILPQDGGYDCIFILIRHECIVLYVAPPVRSSVLPSVCPQPSMPCSALPFFQSTHRDADLLPHALSSTSGRFPGQPVGRTPQFQAAADHPICRRVAEVDLPIDLVLSVVDRGVTRDVGGRDMVTSVVGDPTRPCIHGPG